MNKRTLSDSPLNLACLIATQVALIAAICPSANARDRFNAAHLETGDGGQAATDLSAFEEHGGQLPGRYRVDIYVNNSKVDTRDVEFRMQQNAQGLSTLQPCLSLSDLASWGVMTQRYPALGPTADGCARLSALPQASADFRFSRQQLLLSFPQSSLNNAARGWVDPARWDDGIPAALINYSVSGANNREKKGGGDNGNAQYVNLRPGLNLGPWRLRNYTTWNRSSQDSKSGTSTKWDTVYTYAQRDIRALRSRLTLGDSTTPSDIFDSIPFRGGQLASDDDMLPESLRGYAPVVRGIARTHAQVTIRQNGYIIYQTYVSPGSFEISDMYPTGGSGDLYVTIKESDGSEQILVVPYASVPVLQREGRLKYAMTAGVYRAYDNGIDKTPLAAGTAIYGLPAGYTVYGGGQFSNRYQALALGVGKNLGPVGAVSADVTQAWSRQKYRAREEGQSWRIRYSKNVVQTGTNFTFAGYRYATSGFWDMQDVLNTWRDGRRYAAPERRRNRAELTVTQDLFQIPGNLALSAILEDYWDTNKRMESYSASYNSSYQGISFSLSYSYNIHSAERYGQRSGRAYDRDGLFALTMSIPLDKLFGGHSTYVSYMLNTSKRGNTTNNVSLGGTLLADNNLNWSVMQGYGSQGQGSNSGLNADWRASYAETLVGYARDRYSERFNYGLQGGIVAHRNGITFSQPLGETMALIAAPGAQNVSVLGQSGVKTDLFGYTVIPYLSPYRKNDLTLNTETLADDAELALATQTVIPTRGALVKASYQTSLGKRVLMNLRKRNGAPVPFGAAVIDPASPTAASFIVGDGGQVYLTGLRDAGQLNVSWSSEPDGRCTVNYRLTPSAGGIINLNEQCL
ncbi:Outer membrane usher protein FimD [Klebsiella pasteurii]|uniref:fimbria/pilus outer membrane usher protein n=1 Tax=Klebsiella pasteurii TaxID=2587529 RepID=UPI0011584843|nr:fimbria/pilus outer membrane usher protein [Klebsiella pasteurii]VUS95483.1 Outer membrane usher protein FimD [Klebsiella pasteurii]